MPESLKQSQAVPVVNDKWGRRLSKAGGWVLILVAMAHSLSLFGKQVPENETERQLLDLMANYKLNLMGSLRSMWDLMNGFSIAFAAAALCLGVLSLVLSRERTALLKRVALTIAIWLAAMTAISLHYFFAAPTSFLMVAFADICAGLPETACQFSRLKRLEMIMA